MARTKGSKNGKPRTKEYLENLKQTAIKREHKKIKTQYICHKCSKVTNCVRLNDHLCPKCVEDTN